MLCCLCGLLVICLFLPPQIGPLNILSYLQCLYFKQFVDHHCVSLLFFSVTIFVYPSGAPEFTPVFSGVRVTRSLVLCVCFIDRCLSFRRISFGHCVVCSSLIYGFWLPLWYLQTLLSLNHSRRTSLYNISREKITNSGKMS